MSVELKIYDASKLPVSRKVKESSRRISYQTAESLVGKCDKPYNQNLIDREVYRHLHRLNPGEYPLTDKELCGPPPISPKTIEQRAKRAFWRGLYQWLNLELTEKELDEVVKKGHL